MYHISQKKYYQHHSGSVKSTKITEPNTNLYLTKNGYFLKSHSTLALTLDLLMVAFWVVLFLAADLPSFSSSCKACRLFISPNTAQSKCRSCLRAICPTSDNRRVSTPDWVLISPFSSERTQQWQGCDMVSVQM